RFLELLSSVRADERFKDENGNDLPGSKLLQINAGFDTEGKHGERSIHYEGRALDIQANGKFLQRLAGLAMLAGFDWINSDDSKGHLHVSVQGGHGDFSAATISASLLFGANNGLITSANTFDELNGLIVQNTRPAVQQFLRVVRIEAARGRIKKPFADLITLNA